MNKDAKLPAEQHASDLQSVSEELPKSAPTKRQFLGLAARAIAAGINKQTVAAAIQPALNAMTGAKSREQGLAQLHEEASTALEAVLEPFLKEPGAEFRVGVDLGRSADDLLASIKNGTKNMSETLAWLSTADDMPRPNTEAVMLVHNTRTSINLDLMQLKVMITLERLANDRSNGSTRAAFMGALDELLQGIRVSVIAD